jgi:Cu/Ag efflux protein CusF
VKRLPSLLSFALLLAAPALHAAALHAADDSPTFVVQNQLLAPAAIPVTASTAPSSAATLPDGRQLSAQLTGPVLGVRIGDSEPIVIDPRATPDCAPVLIAFADDSAVLLWRGHGENNTRDLRVARFIDNTWQPAATLNFDDWHAAAVPANEGPAVDSRGPHIAVAWYTEGYGARINVSTSSNAGDQWLQPNRVDDIAPVGRPSIVLLDDGAQLVSWVERLDNDYVVLLRRISALGTLSVPVRLARLATDPGHPRLARVKDGDATPAQLLLTYTDNANPVARLITLPSPAELAAAESDSCGCDPRPEDQRGFGIKGRITSIDPNTGTITLQHAAIPGVMKAATTVFKAAPDLIASAPQDRVLIARIERLGSDWWLFNIRTLGAP